MPMPKGASTAALTDQGHYSSSPVLPATKIDKHTHSVMLQIYGRGPKCTCQEAACVVICVLSRQ